MPIVGLFVILLSNNTAGLRSMKLWLKSGSNKHSLNGDQWLKALAPLSMDSLVGRACALRWSVLWREICQCAQYPRIFPWP
jgi:hypothetical protein